MHYLNLAISCTHTMLPASQGLTTTGRSSIRFLYHLHKPA